MTDPNQNPPLGDTATITYDQTGNKLSATRANGQIISYNSYDPSGRKYSSGYTGRGELRTFYDITSGPTTAFQAYYIYDPSGNVMTRNINQYQTHTNSTYDALNRLAQAQHFLVGSSPKFNYGYDEMSNRKYEQRDGMLADGFGYDVNNQLNSFQRDGTLSGSSVSGGALNTLVYDANGNRRSVVESGVTTTYAAANNLNQYPTVGGMGATYDGNGNLKTYSGWTYTYDAMNRLTAASKTGASATFHYDGLNRQITRNFNGNGLVYFSVWDGWDLVEEYTQGNALYASYLHGAKSDELISMTRSGQAYYFFQDGRGNTSQVANSSGALVETCKYDVHGEAAITVAPGKTATGNRFLFTGREYYQSLGLYNYRNRFYSSDIGRFLQPDPIGFKGDASNMYRYCGNNASNQSDPSGEDWHGSFYFTQSGNNVNLYIPVTYSSSGGVPSGASGIFNQGIQSKWNGPIGQYNVTSTVYSPWSGDPTNNVQVVSGQGQSNAGKLYYPGDTSDPGGVAAHEAGHWMGIQRNSPDPNDLMGNTAAKPSENDIRLITASGRYTSSNLGSTFPTFATPTTWLPGETVLPNGGQVIGIFQRMAVYQPFGFGGFRNFGDQGNGYNGFADMAYADSVFGPVGAPTGGGGTLIHLPPLIQL